MFGHLLFAGSQPAQKTWCWEKVSKTTADVEREKFAGNSHWFTIQWRCGFLEPTFHRVWHINIIWNSILQHLLWSSYDSSITKTVLSRKKFHLVFFLIMLIINFVCLAFAFRNIYVFITFFSFDFVSLQIRSI